MVVAVAYGWDGADDGCRASGGRGRRGRRDQHGEFAEVLGGGGDSGSTPGRHRTAQLDRKQSLVAGDRDDGKCTEAVRPSFRPSGAAQQAMAAETGLLKIIFKPTR